MCLTAERPPCQITGRLSPSGKLCDAVSRYIRTLSAERDKLKALGNAIDRSSKLWEYYSTNLANLDQKIKTIGAQSADCSRVN